MAESTSDGRLAQPLPCAASTDVMHLQQDLLAGVENTHNSHDFFIIFHTHFHLEEANSL